MKSSQYFFPKKPHQNKLFSLHSPILELLDLIYKNNQLVTSTNLTLVCAPLLSLLEPSNQEYELIKPTLDQTIFVVYEFERLPPKMVKGNQNTTNIEC